jgi:hypothetical protein
MDFELRFGTGGVVLAASGSGFGRVKNGLWKPKWAGIGGKK